MLRKQEQRGGIMAHSGANGGFAFRVVVVRHFEADHGLRQRGELVGDGGGNL
jgi:hypothetical protein